MRPRARGKFALGRPNYHGGTMSYCRTTEQRERQSQLIHRWKPWEKSTGPRTAEGRQRAAMRGFKGGLRPTLRLLRWALREQAKALR